LPANADAEGLQKEMDDWIKRNLHRPKIAALYEEFQIEVQMDVLEEALRSSPDFFSVREPQPDGSLLDLWYFREPNGPKKRVPEDA
jgi:hypothetical protein